MERSKARTLRHAGIWVLTGGGHLLLVLMGVYFNRLYSTARRPVSAEPMFVMINMSPQETTASQAQSARHPIQALRPPTTPDARDVPPVATPHWEAQEITPIDWDRESKLAARAAMVKDTGSTRHAFGTSLTPSTVLCKQPKADFTWNPEPKKAGFIGGLPYVRLGSHCIVGLPFFGCALGKLPEANSQLFVNMTERDRQATSVPDIPNCVQPPD